MEKISKKIQSRKILNRGEINYLFENIKQTEVRLLIDKYLKYVGVNNNVERLIINQNDEKLFENYIKNHFISQKTILEIMINNTKLFNIFIKKYPINWRLQVDLIESHKTDIIKNYIEKWWLCREAQSILSRDPKLIMMLNAS